AESAPFVHRVAEAAKLAFADRLAWYGDPDHVDVPLAALLDDAYARQRAAGIGAAAAPQLQPGSPDGRVARLPAPQVAARALPVAVTRVGVAEPALAARPPVQEGARREFFIGGGCHLDVIERHGIMEAATPSGGWWSYSPAIPELGFSVNARL